MPLRICSRFRQNEKKGKKRFSYGNAGPSLAILMARGRWGHGWTRLCHQRQLYPYTTVYITHPWGGLPSSIAREPKGCQHRTIHREARREMFASPTLFAPTLLRLGRYRAWKIRPWGGVMHRQSYTVGRAKLVLAMSPYFTVFLGVTI